MVLFSSSRICQAVDGDECAKIIEMKDSYRYVQPVLILMTMVLTAFLYGGIEEFCARIACEEKRLDPARPLREWRWYEWYKDTT
jgi:hypothetical protein